jgi:hypothetical protein
MLIRCESCGRRLAEDQATKIERNGQVFYYCSEACPGKGGDLGAHESGDDAGAADGSGAEG